MTIQDLNAAIDELARMIAEINAYLDEEQKGGAGSGCHGDNCGRPSAGGSHNDAKPTDSESEKPKPPRSGVRPSAVNPNRREIEYNEEPSSDGRPRSGVRPTKR